MDITCEMKLGNATNMITYHGLFQGKSPKPDGQPGFIMMQSNVVFFGDVISCMKDIDDNIAVN